LIQLSHRAIGVVLPRDAKQQYLGGNLIPPYLVEALQPGDALYFINQVGQVDHTGFYVGNQQILHATGKRVQINSLDPKAKNYLRRFGTDFIGAKRFGW
jgi:cell wall-associated NlpC family hydrolase